MATKGKKANLFVWIILGLLIVGLAGFGADGFGGRVTTIGSVGDRDLRVQDYFNAIQQEIQAEVQARGQGVSFAEAQQIGLDQAALSQIVTAAALENEAIGLGISVGDDIVREELMGIAAFRGVDGQFNREAYRFSLQREGLSESQFEDRLRLETARNILQAAVVTGAPAPQTYVDALMRFIAERRSFAVVTLGRDDLVTPVPAPSEEQLRAFHEADPEQFTLPEARRVSYAWIAPAMLIDEVPLDEAALHELYESRATEFRQPERRLVERLIYPDFEQAAAAMARLEANEADFSDLVAERGMTLDDVDMGDVTQADLAASGEAVFALDAPGFTGPHQTPFGPAIYRMNAVLPAQEVSFDEAEPQLREQLAQEHAGRMIADLYDDLEDLLAGGATLEQLADETQMQFGQIDLLPDTSEGIAAYQSFRDAAQTAGPNDFPVIEQLEDGGLFAIRLDEVVPPRVQPLEEVEVQVVEAWEQAEAEARLMARAEEVRTALEAGQSPEDVGLAAEMVEGVTRQGFVEGLPRLVIQRGFETEAGEHAIVAAQGEVHVLSVLEVLPPADDTPEAMAMRRNIADQTRLTLQQDLFSVYAQRLQAEAGVRLDQNAIQSVHNQFR